MERASQHLLVPEKVSQAIAQVLPTFNVVLIPVRLPRAGGFASTLPMVAPVAVLSLDIVPGRVTMK